VSCTTPSSPILYGRNVRLAEGRNGGPIGRVLPGAKEDVCKGGSSATGKGVESVEADVGTLGGCKRVAAAAGAEDGAQSRVGAGARASARVGG